MKVGRESRGESFKFTIFKRRLRGGPQGLKTLNLIKERASNSVSGRRVGNR